MTLANLAKSFARTAVPYVVGVVIALALRAGVDLHGYAPEITVAVGSIYYGLVRVAEEHLSPGFGWLLGVAAQPRYVQQAKGQKDRGDVDILTLALIALIVVVILVLLNVV